MSLAAHTNKPGKHTITPTFHKSWRGTNGSTWDGVVYWTTKESVKSDPVWPGWVRRPDNTVLFKRCSSYRRYIMLWEVKPIQGISYHANGTVEGRYVDYTCDRTGNHPGLSNMPYCMANSDSKPYWDPNQIRRAEVECLLKFREEGVALGNALAEAKSTVDMIAGTTIKLARGLLAVKRGNFKQLASVIGSPKGLTMSAADYYLQWKFGWAPLMGDIRDGVELLKRQLQIDDKIVRNKRVLTQNPKWSFSIGGPGGTQSRIEGSGSHTSTVCLWAKFKPDKWRQAAEAYGLDDPLGILWEVTPWSFVVDWVMPVGDLLSALAVRERLDFVGGYCSTKAQGSSRIQVPKDPYPLRVEPLQTVKVDRFGFERIAYSALPFPMPYVKSPLSSSHTATAIALLRQLLK